MHLRKPFDREAPRRAFEWRAFESFASTCMTMVWWHLYGQHSALVLRVTSIQRLMQSVWNTCPHNKPSTGSEPNSDKQNLHSLIASV